MVSDDRQQRTSPARAAAALSFLLLATGVIGAGADAERANAQGASLDNSYAAPEPAGFGKAAVRPAAAFYDSGAAQFRLKYDDVRSAATPRQALLDFCQSTYDAAATLAAWNRAELER